MISTKKDLMTDKKLCKMMLIIYRELRKTLVELASGTLQQHLSMTVLHRSLNT